MEREDTSYRERIRELIEPLVEAEGMELVEVECLRMKSRWLVRIYIDKEEGVTLDDCAEISHLAGDVLDVHNIPRGPYVLEVSSPGLDRPLTRDKDFLTYRGSAVEIRLSEPFKGRKNFRGRLIDYIDGDTGKVLVVDAGGALYHIPRKSVLRANLKYEF